MFLKLMFYICQLSIILALLKVLECWFSSTKHFKASLSTTDGLPIPGRSYFGFHQIDGFSQNTSHHGEGNHISRVQIESYRREISRKLLGSYISLVKIMNFPIGSSELHNIVIRISSHVQIASKTFGQVETFHVSWLHLSFILIWSFFFCFCFL